MPSAGTLAVVAGLALSTAPIPQAHADDRPPPPDALGELRRSFTLGGAPVPPRVFSDMGDGDAADGKPPLVTVDAWAAIASDRFADEVRTRDGWVSQTGRVPGGRGTETEAYRFLGATPDGLMALVTVNATSEANFAPVTLHVVAGAVTKALDPDGRPYDRIDVTVLAAYPLGDGWRGRATLTGDTVTVATEGGAMRSPRNAENLHSYRISRP